MYTHLHSVIPDDCPHSLYRGLFLIFPLIWKFYFSFIFSFEIPSPLEFPVTLGEMGRDLFWNYVRQYTFQEERTHKDRHSKGRTETLGKCKWYEKKRVWNPLEESILGVGVEYPPSPWDHYKQISNLSFYTHRFAEQVAWSKHIIVISHWRPSVGEFSHLKSQEKKELVGENFTKLFLACNKTWMFI